MTPLCAALRAAAPTISVGVLTADLLDLGAEIAVLESAGVRVVHFDVMDGCFCPMTTFRWDMPHSLPSPLTHSLSVIQIFVYPLPEGERRSFPFMHPGRPLVPPSLAGKGDRGLGRQGVRSAP